MSELSDFNVSLQTKVKQMHIMDGIGYQKVIEVDNLIIERNVFDGQNTMHSLGIERI